MNEEEIQRDLKQVQEFEAMIARNQEETIQDLHSDDVSSIRILIKLAKSELDSQGEISDEKLKAVRFMEKRVEQL